MQNMWLYLLDYVFYHNLPCRYFRLNFYRYINSKKKRERDNKNNNNSINVFCVKFIVDKKKSVLVVILISFNKMLDIINYNT